jgi:hypothetical protein
MLVRWPGLPSGGCSCPRFQARQSRFQIGEMFKQAADGEEQEAEGEGKDQVEYTQPTDQADSEYERGQNVQDALEDVEKSMSTHAIVLPYLLASAHWLHLAHVGIFFGDSARQ